MLSCRSRDFPTFGDIIITIIEELILNIRHTKIYAYFTSCPFLKVNRMSSSA